MEEVRLYIAAGEAEKPSRIDGCRRCSFVVLMQRGDELRAFWGLARIRDTTALFAFAINAALTRCLPDDFDVGPWPTVTVIVKSPDFWERIDQASHREAYKPKKTADQREAWKSAAALRGMFEIRPARGPETAEDDRLLSKATVLQRDYVQRALLAVPTDFIGLSEEGELETGALA
ncbi:hypothetical protein HJB56_26270 [Rhizobium lentis]|uniref:hypothetical protein n=1 Tax=Rhizobium lentis TaxID=1138194 RepID=UPI001C833BE0|nr:hypothetical protein [Rhizobium lentis]MBX4972628.1 hypothetical protein [Rhizobium lentis]MBX5086236.1 hypothetical protein [Rhizobium lentis]MBX5096348.1 hypothetical protein [Rhizobium lentis]MBX5123516.1 hypothetical protein [Rhizobium lentis]